MNEKITVQISKSHISIFRKNNSQHFEVSSVTAASRIRLNRCVVEARKSRGVGFDVGVVQAELTRNYRFSNAGS